MANKEGKFRGVEGSPLIPEEIKSKMDDYMKRKKANSDKQFELMEKHPRCAILPSPEELDVSICSPGSDKTDTLEDFKRFKNWVTNSELLNTDIYNRMGWESLKEDDTFYTLIKLSFGLAFDAMRNTRKPELEELVIWYYAGHGLGKENTEGLDYLSTPRLESIPFDPRYHAVANEFVDEGRKVKGGELCLHKVGFCDLYGLLKPWIAAVKAESINATGKKKKNKHLVIILDSCYSGIIAQELDDFKRKMQEKDPTFLAENTVTIQAACGPDERTVGGYFTPCFIYLNENEKMLKELKDEWGKMKEEQRNKYKLTDFPSPMVVTTRHPSAGATMELDIQNFKLALFPDARFFKFCSMKVYEDQDMKEFVDKERVLDSAKAKKFMSSSKFNVLDYKLKTYKGSNPSDPHAGTPMGLFLLEDQENPGYAVCAHIHFEKGNTGIAQRINLVHHKKTPTGSLKYLEETVGQYVPKFQVYLGPNAPSKELVEAAKALVKACYQFVNKTNSGWWKDVSKWNMTESVNKSFRVKDRSAWEDGYLKHIEKYYQLPKVAN